MAKFLYAVQAVQDDGALELVGVWTGLRAAKKAAAERYGVQKWFRYVNEHWQWAEGGEDADGREVVVIYTIRPNEFYDYGVRR